MRCSILSILAGSLLASSAVAEFTYTATVLQDGQEVDASSALEFLSVNPRTRLPNSNAAPASEPSKRDNLNAEWCGASQKAPLGDSISSVFAYFSVPDLTLRAGQGTPQYASSWVGIDGLTCTSVLLQAGVSTQITANGTQTTATWFEWYPDVAYTIAGFPANPGDWIALTIDVTSPNVTQLTITNVGSSYSLVLKLNGDTKLCLVDADWIVEDYYNGFDNVPFASFADIWFEGVAAQTAQGKTLGIDGATMLDMGGSAANPQNAKCIAVEYDDTDFYVYSQN